MPDKTHTYRARPRISARYLADFMAATETAKRTIVRDSKYQPRARVIQHDEARSTVSKFIRDRDADLSWLGEEAQRLRDRVTDSDFDRDLYEHNAEYIARFAQVWPVVKMPTAEINAPGSSPPIVINGVTITIDLQFRLRRKTKTNKVRIGAGMLRYSKGKELVPDVGAWQSAFILGYLRETNVEQNIEPWPALCLTFDVYSGSLHPAPSDSIRRFNQIRSACATIAERWPNIEAPPGAII